MIKITLILFIVNSFLFASKYIVNPNLKRYDDRNVVMDFKNNFMWQDNKVVKESRRNWLDSLRYCENLSLSGYDDWRLPTKIELNTLLDEYEHNPRISTIFKHKRIGFYWTVSEWSKNNSFAWFISFAYGQTYYYYYKTSEYFVRCVRDENDITK